VKKSCGVDQYGSVQGSGDARGGTSGGAHPGCERVASDGACGGPGANDACGGACEGAGDGRDASGGACEGASDGCGDPGASDAPGSAYEGANSGGSVQGPDGASGEASGALVSAARKRKPVGGWPATVPTVVPARTPTAVVAAKEPVEGWGHVALVVPAGASTAMTAPTTCSLEAATIG
jgi:hypothetical protein